MKVYIAAPYLHQSIIHKLFAGHDVQVLPKDYRKGRISCDLLVFSGGEDINPRYYASPTTNPGWYNDERDVLEFQVYEDIGERIFPTKVLGICRGHQLINVAMGGTLVQDIYTKFGKSHSGIHPLTWYEKTPFNEFLPETNSMHHQGIERIGDGQRWELLAVEPSTKIIEAIVWGNMYLGVQFHPEAFGNELSAKFRTVIEEWIAGGSLTGKPAEKKSAKSPWATYGRDLPVETSTVNVGTGRWVSDVNVNISTDWAGETPVEVDNIPHFFTDDEDE